MTDPAFEADLKALDEAYRVSARSGGWEEEDTSREGILPDYIQPAPAGPLADLELDRLPEGARFVGWAWFTFGTIQTFSGEEAAITVYAVHPDDPVLLPDHQPAGRVAELTDPVVLGTWPLRVATELMRRYREASGV